MGYKKRTDGSRRTRGYCWPTWLTKLLADEERCYYRAWVKVNTCYEKTPDDPDRKAFFEEWTERHDLITARRAKELTAEGWKVKLEEEGEFKLAGNSVDLAGKPDIVALAPGGRKEALVVDAKSGRRRQSDHWQVLIYLFALPLTWLQGFVLRGEVEYHDGREKVRPFGPEERARLTEVMRLVTSPEPPEPTPSARDCRYCDVAACPARYKAPTGSAGGVF